MKKPRSQKTAADVKSSQRDARSGSLQRMVRRFRVLEELCVQSLLHCHSVSVSLSRLS